MADAPTPRSAPTAHYGWAKPDVGGDDDVWGGELNADLDSIDSIVFGIQGSVPGPSTTTPPMDGTGAVGVSALFARADHVHPTDTSRYAASNPSGFQTAAQVAASLAPYALTASIPVVATTPPLMDGTAAIGASGKWADGAHVHPTDTSRYAASNPANYITAAGAPVQSVAGRTGAVTLTHGDITDWATATASFTYTLPNATTTVLGGVKVDGTTITAAAGVISAAAAGGTNPNKLDNGDMSVNQRNYAVGSGSIFTQSYNFMLDRWVFGGTKVTKWNWGINYPYSPPAGFQYCQGCQVLTAAAAAAGDVNCILQTIEWDDIVDVQWGTANAQPLMLSFWAISTMTGGFSLGIYSGTTATYRLYITTFNITTANVWQKFTITIPGDTNAIWVPGSTLSLVFDLGSGTSFNTATQGWQSTTVAMRLSTGLNITTTVGARFGLTGVKLEAGSAATPFVFEHPQVKIARCQRYYQTGFMLLNSYQGIGGAAYQLSAQLINTMRATPTMTALTNSNSNVGSFSLSAGGGAMYASAIGSAPGSCLFNFTYSASAEI